VNRRHKPILRPGTKGVIKTVVNHRGETAAFHRFLIPGDPELTFGRVEGGEAIT